MTFEHSETQIADPRIMVSYLSFEFDEYQIIRENGILYVYGKNYQPKELFKKKSSDSYAILLDLMVLHNNLDISDSIRPRSFGADKINENISDKDLKQILKFVKKYGFPYYKQADDFSSNIFSNTISINDKIMDSAKKNILNNVSPFAVSGKFNISLFVYTTHQFLSKDFLQVIAYNEIQDDLPDFLTEVQKKYVNHLIKNWFPKYKRLMLMSHHCNTFITRWNNEAVSLEVETENIMHLSAYYLCLMASAGNIGGYIRQCKGCGMLFVTENPRLQYCQNPCTRQNVHMRKIRKNAKSLK